MPRRVILAALLTLACAPAPPEAGALQPATVRVQNESWDRVSAYALCDGGGPVRLGSVEALETATFTVRACQSGSGAFGVRALAGGTRTTERAQFGTGDRLVLVVRNTLPPVLYVEGGP